MAMRDLVTGGAACAVPGSSSSSNPLGALTNALLGSSSKTQVSFVIEYRVETSLLIHSRLFRRFASRLELEVDLVLRGVFVFFLPSFDFSFL